MPRKVKRKRKSKSMGNKRFRHKRLSIKLKRRFPKKRTRKNRKNRKNRKQKGGGPLDWLFGKKEETYKPTESETPQQKNAAKLVNDEKTFGEQVFGQLQKLGDNMTDLQKNITGEANAALNDSMKSMLADLNSMKTLVNKMVQPFKNFNGKKCPCCKQPINITEELSKQTQAVSTESVSPEKQLATNPLLQMNN